jgi:hypothetical protein
VSILAGLREGHVLQQFGRGNDDMDEVEVLQRIRNDLHPGQLAFVDDQSTSILGVSAGYGAGKTRALCAKAVHLAMANQGFIGVVMEPTGPLIRDIWQSDFDDFLEAYDIPYTFRASPLPEYTCTYRAAIPRSCAAALRTGSASSASTAPGSWLTRSTR